MQTNRRAGILASIFVIIHRKISTVDLEKEFDGSNPYMKYERNWVINNLECAHVQTDHRWEPF